MLLIYKNIKSITLITVTNKKVIHICLGISEDDDKIKIPSRKLTLKQIRTIQKCHPHRNKSLPILRDENRKLDGNKGRNTPIKLQ